MEDYESFLSLKFPILRNVKSSCWIDCLSFILFVVHSEWSLENFIESNREISFSETIKHKFTAKIGLYNTKPQLSTLKEQWDTTLKRKWDEAFQDCMEIFVFHEKVRTELKNLFIFYHSETPKKPHSFYYFHKICPEWNDIWKNKPLRQKEDFSLGRERSLELFLDYIIEIYGCEDLCCMVPFSVETWSKEEGFLQWIEKKLQKKKTCEMILLQVWKSSKKKSPFKSFLNKTNDLILFGKTYHLTTLVFHPDNHFYIAFRYGEEWIKYNDIPDKNKRFLKVTNIDNLLKENVPYILFYSIKPSLF